MRAIIIACILISSLRVAGQEQQVQRKNIIKTEFISHALFNSAFIASYERLTKPNQSLAITAGFLSFPKFNDLGDGIKTTEETNRSGYKGGIEYRFYLKKENKFQAPHGLYIGPYFSYLHFKNERNIHINMDNGSEQDARFNASLNIFNVGAQIGYQFQFNNRWTLDIVFMGPSISNYTAKLKLDGTFTPGEENDIKNQIIERIIDRFPLLDELVTNKEVTAKGDLDTWAYGYRYQLSLGYVFGRK